MNVEGVTAISFKVALKVIKFLGMSEVVTIDDLAHEDVKLCQDIREKLDHVLDKVNVVYDKNFDKFEMYSLRNIFRIPDDLGDKTKVGIVIDGSTAEMTVLQLFSRKQMRKGWTTGVTNCYTRSFLCVEKTNGRLVIMFPYRCLFFCQNILTSNI